MLVVHLVIFICCRFHFFFRVSVPSCLSDELSCVFLVKRVIPHDPGIRNPVNEIPESWRRRLATNQEALAALSEIRNRIPGRATIPAQDLLFAALARTAPDEVRVIIVGQDPYPTPGHACGVAFAVSTNQPDVPRSLRNIFAEVARDTGGLRTEKDLHSWSAQGVLLLNRWLSLDADLRHAWDVITEACLRVVWQTSAHPVCAFLWGRPASQACRWMTDTPISSRLVLHASHPSPLSFRRPCGSAPAFMGCSHFSLANRFLTDQGSPAIAW